MKSSECLEIAAQRIELNGGFVCWTLLDIDEVKFVEICSRIRKSLAPATTVTNWLLMNYGIRQFNGEIVRTYRAAWCRWMAEGYRAIGD